MTATDRNKEEQAFHDWQARQRAATFAQNPQRFVFDNDDYLDHETWIRPGFRQLGDLAGRQILDFGCGHGMAAVVMARCGACVTAFDLSSAYIEEARRRSYANQVEIRFLVADGNRLPFADRTFDRIWGNAVLHHLDLHWVANELCRVLRPGGWAVFCEPWGENPFLNFARRRMSYPEKARTPKEEPLRLREIRQLRNVFGFVEVQGFQLLAMARRIPLTKFAVARLESWDRKLLVGVPALQRFCRYVVVTLRP